MFQYACPQCKAFLTANDGDEGKLVACPNCGMRMAIPNPSANQQQQTTPPPPPCPKFLQSGIPNPMLPHPASTPANQMNIATINDRITALVVDWLIVSLPAIAFQLYSICLSGSREGLSLPLLSVISLGIGLVYNTIMEASKYQATVGKLILRLVVVDKNMQRISFNRSVGRNICKTLINRVLLISYFSAFFLAYKQTLHDLIASTYVVNHPNKNRLRHL